MPVIELMHFNIRAPLRRLLKLRDFYCGVVGLVEGERPPFRSKGFWLYAGDRPLVHLVIGGDGDASETSAISTLDHIAFGCADFDAMRAVLDAQRIDYQMREVPLLRQRQIFCRDPAGNGVELLFDYTPKQHGD